MLDKEILGEALYTAAKDFNDTDIENLEESREAFWKAVAEQIIIHFKTLGQVVVVGAAGTIQ
jgi:hypothetical protein